MGILADTAAKLATQISEQIDVDHLAGLCDNHIKFLSYFLRHEYKVENFRLEVNHLESPKKIVIHVKDKDGKEVFFKPKSMVLFDKMVDYINLPAWQIEFAKKEHE